jgi:GTP-binding protein
LISRLTRAQPKVAGYPFTTLSPVLGTLQVSDRQLVIADIPGLIEGASDGAGLGHEFLAHVERTRLLVHVLDLAPLDGSDPVPNHATVEHELGSYDPRLEALPRILALSKADLVDEQTAHSARAEWERRLGPEVPVIITSSATNLGLDVLAGAIAQHVDDGPPAIDTVIAQGAAGGGEIAEHRVYRPSVPRRYTVQRTGEGTFAVTGEGVERLLARYDIDNEEALAHLERRLKGIGVLRALEAEGFEPGDEVEIAGIAFDLDPDQ